MDSRKIPMTIDAESGRLINSDGTWPTRSEELPRLLFGDVATLCVSIVRTAEADGLRTLSPVALNESGEYCLFGAVGGASDLLFRSSSDGFNLPGSWTDGSDPDCAAGQLTFTVNTGTVGFRTAVTGRDRRKCEFALTMVPAGTLDTRVLGKDFFLAEARPEITESVDAALENTFVTTQQLAAYFRADEGFEFSSDAQNWHTERLLNDQYYRPANQDNSLIFCIGPAGTATDGVASVNGQTGTVTLNCAAIGAESAGSAAAVAAHATDENAHLSLFATKAEENHTHEQAEIPGLTEALTAKEAAGTAAGLLANHAAASDAHSALFAAKLDAAHATDSAAHSALFDAKAAVDLANLTAAGKDIIAKLVVPDLSRGTNFAAATIYGPTTKDGIIVATGGGTIMSIYCKNSVGAVYYASSSQWWAWLIIPRGTYYSGDVAGFFYPLKGTLA